MKIRRDLLQIASGVRHADGTKAEPEQQPVQRIIESTAPISMGRGGPSAGQLPVRFVTELEAGQLADIERRRCVHCRFFNHRAFQNVLTVADHPTAPIEKRRAVNKIRASLLQSNNANLNEAHSGLDGDFDVEAALKSCGVCDALTELDNDLNAVHPLSSCPAHTITPSTPHGLFQPKDKAARKEGAQGYDAVMRQAQGKVIP